MAGPWPRKRARPARSASRMAAQVAASARSSQARSVGPASNEIEAKLLTMSTMRSRLSRIRAAVLGA